MLLCFYIHIVFFSLFHQSVYASADNIGKSTFISDFPKLYESYTAFTKISSDFKEDLSNHKLNGVLIRENVPRGNFKFQPSLFESNFCEINFKAIRCDLDSKKSEGAIKLEKVTPTILAIFQALAEDQNTFYVKYLEKLNVDKFSTENILSPTCILIHNQSVFSKKYNECLSSLYPQLIVAFSSNIEVSHVIGDCHGTIKDFLLSAIQNLDYLDRLYHSKLERVKNPISPHPSPSSEKKSLRPTFRKTKSYKKEKESKSHGGEKVRKVNSSIH